MLSVKFKTFQIDRSANNSEQLQSLSSKDKDFIEKYTSVRRTSKKYTIVF